MYVIKHMSVPHRHASDFMAVMLTVPPEQLLLMPDTDGVAQLLGSHHGYSSSPAGGSCVAAGDTALSRSHRTHQRVSQAAADQSDLQACSAAVFGALASQIVASREPFKVCRLLQLVGASLLLGLRH